MKYLLLIPLFLLTISISCNKEDKGTPHPLPRPLDGTYSGTFQRQTGNDGDKVVNVSLTFENQAFSGQGGTGHYPAMCKGNFQVSADSIHFTNTCFFTADFDWTLILNGSYDIYMIDDQLIITRTYASQAKDIYNLRQVMPLNN